MDNLAEQRIQDIFSIVSDIGNEDDLVRTLNVKLIEPFFESFFSLTEEDIWLREQGLVSLIRLMKTHYIEDDMGIDSEVLQFYKNFIPHVDVLLKGVSMEINSENIGERLKQKYFLQLWCECVGLIVHSHQKEIIELLQEKNILVKVVEKMKLDDYKNSTVLIKTSCKIIIELLHMKYYDYVENIINQNGIFEFIIQQYRGSNKEFVSVTNEILHTMIVCEDNRFKTLLLLSNVEESEYEKIKKYHVDLSKILMEGKPEMDSQSDDYVNYIDDEDDDDDVEDIESDSGSDEDSDSESDSDDYLDDVINEMSDFFESIKENQDALMADISADSSIPDMKDDPLMPKDLPVFSKKFEHMYDEVNRQDNLFV